MGNTYMIGDIHGCCKTFRFLVEKEIELKKSDMLYCLGDYIDRGPDSKGVIDFILELRAKGFQVRTLRGNHEQMLLDSFRSMDVLDLWIANGGGTTLESFGIDSVFQLGEVYQGFFQQTELCVTTKDFILAHAGLNFKLANPMEDEKAMLWIRNFRVNPSFLAGRVLIHGHTPVTKDFILSQQRNGAVNLDGGCVYNHYDSFGYLCALNFDDWKFMAIKNIEG